MLNKLLTIAKIVGIAPIYTKNNKQITAWPVFLLVLAWVRCILCIYTEVKPTKLGTFKPIRKLTILYYIFQCVSLSVGLVNAITRAKVWSDLFEVIRLKDASTVAQKLVIILYNIFFLIAMANESRYWLFSAEIKPLTLITQWFFILTCEYCQYFMTFFIHFNATILARRYDELLEELSSVFDTHMIAEELSRHAIKQRVKPFVQSFKKLYYTVGDFNSVFGLETLILMVGISVKILNETIYHLNHWKNDPVLILSFLFHLYFGVVSCS